MNNTQISEDRHPSRDREIAEQIESALSDHPGIPRESLYMRLRGRPNDAELAAARRQVLVEALKDLLRSDAVVEARVGTQALLYLKGEQPQGAAVYSLHQPPMKTWVDPSLKGSYAPSERVVDERTIVAIPKERDDRPVRAVAKASNPRIQAVTELLESSAPVMPAPVMGPDPEPIVVAKAEQIVTEPEVSEPEPEQIVVEPERIDSEPIAAAKTKAPPRNPDQRTVSTNLPISEADQFSALAETMNISASKLLKRMIRARLAQGEPQVLPVAPVAPSGPCQSRPESYEFLVAEAARANAEAQWLRDRLRAYLLALQKE
jgi:hypothetical protein